MTNNASFNCVATKVLVTWKGWPDRQKFLDLLAHTLNNTPPRYAYYPGAHERFALRRVTCQTAGRDAALDDVA